MLCQICHECHSDKKICSDCATRESVNPIDGESMLGWLRSHELVYISHNGWTVSYNMKVHLWIVRGPEIEIQVACAQDAADEYNERIRSLS